jgi:GR25 family glycosyltransferase involved in LPS biosynthesis
MRNNGFNNFDMICYINLEHRTDRLEHITKELSKTNIDENKINRIEGVYLKDFPILGCAKSHCLSLEKFLASSEDVRNCLILEDDFEFTQEQDKVNELINGVFNELGYFDVLMISSNTLREREVSGKDFVTKIEDAQTLSGYVVSRKFAPALLENFKESVIGLESNYGVVNAGYCVDMNMKKLQPISEWYCLRPKIGKQMESFSDNENQVVNYGC